jgi:hypothetical protein
MFPDIKSRLLGSFEAMEMDLKNLSSRLLESKSFKFEDYREVELLMVIMKDEMNAEVDELGCNVERRDWVAVEKNLQDLTDLMKCLIQARDEAKEARLSKQ